RGLARAVAADDADDRAARDAAGEIVDQQSVAERLGDAAHLDDLLTEAFARRNVQLGGLVAGLELLRLQLLEAREPRLALGLTAFRIRPHPLELGLDGALTGFFLRGFLLEALLLLLEPGAVVAFERNPAAPVELEDPARHVVEEVTVV